MRAQDDSVKKIYCAGPLFNDPEQREMEALAKALEDASYTTFLPHRDGLEFSKAVICLHEKGILAQTANAILSRAIFALDVYQVEQSDGVVVNMNGRVPDEGAMVEAGIAWVLHKKIVIYKKDSRTLLNGTDNPLVLGLSNFISVDSAEDVVKKFDMLFEKKDDGAEHTSSTPLSFDAMVKKGGEVYNMMVRKKEDVDALCDVLLELFGGECGS
jgi:nucleoside 2-deoxyribosyltransferase